MIKGLESLLHNSRFTSAQHVADNRTTADVRLHNSRFTSAQHVADNRTTADVRLHNSCCAADDTISFDNYSYLFQQLILSFPTTISVISNRQSQYFQILSVFLSSFLLDSQNNCLSLRRQPDNNG